MKWFGFVAFVCLCFLSCGRGEDRPLDRWMHEKEKIRVLSTVGMVDDLVRQVGGEQVVRITLIDPELDPHSYELVKGDMDKLYGAQIIFYSGLGLEHGASLHRYLDENSRAVAIGDAIADADPAASVYIDGQLDPHIWMDVSLWLRGADVIAETLSERDPQNAELYHQRARRVKAELARVDAELQEMMSQVPERKRYLVSSHDALNYFTRRYLGAGSSWKERCIAPEGLSPEGQLSLAQLSDVIDHLERHRISVLFPESNLNRDAIERIVAIGAERGMRVHLASEPLYADAMGEGQTYAEMMRHNGRVISENLQQSRP